MRIISPVLLTFALAVSGTLITPPISAHAAESLVATHDNENAKMELYQAIPRRPGKPWNTE